MSCEYRDPKKHGTRCYEDSVAICDNCGISLCAKHAFLDFGIECPNCLEERCAYSEDPFGDDLPFRLGGFTHDR